MNLPLTRAALRTPNWLKRLGAVGFAFFFLKGLLWLSVPWLLHALWR